MKPHYYTVRFGKHSGIYANTLDFQRQVRGWKYPHGRGFYTLKDAEAYYNLLHPHNHEIYTSAFLFNWKDISRAGWGVYWCDSFKECGSAIVANEEIAQLIAILVAISVITFSAVSGHYRIHVDSDKTLKAFGPPPSDDENADTYQLAARIRSVMDLLEDHGIFIELVKVERQNGFETTCWQNKLALALARKGCRAKPNRG